MSRALTLAEPLAVFLGIEYYLWVLRWTHSLCWLPIVAFILLTHLARRERPEALGFRSGNLRSCLKTYAPMLIFSGLAGLAAGFLLQTTRPIAFQQALFAFALYVPWGIFQQYMLNGYFLQRFDAALSHRAAPVLSAVLFAGAHTPNWFLMAVTLFGGYAATGVYRRHRNLYLLGIAHALFGFLLYMVIPDSISHHLNVGPNH